MYEWKETKSSRVAWIQIGEALIHLRNVNTIFKKGDGSAIRFADGHLAEFSDTPVSEIAELIGFRKVDGDSTSQSK